MIVPDRPLPAGLPTAPNYGQELYWLCLPGRPDPCSGSLATTALNPNGYGSSGPVTPAKEPAADCFYVYPTVSRDAGLNSDLFPQAEERNAAKVQFARFSSVCRPFAPVYRQVTLAALARVMGGGDVGANFEIAYQDVRNAWRQYLQQHNGGRPFVLVGHSQGTIHLTRLIAEEIEGKPAAARMLSALLIGYNVEVPVGQAVGGTFKSTPLCTRHGQTGCIVSYVSFRAEAPPPASARFGRTAKPGMTVACVNPASLRPGYAPLDSYWFTAGTVAAGAEPITWSRAGAPTTEFVRTEGLASGSCVNEPGAGYLAVRVDADPRDARTDRIPGDVFIAGRLLPDWGLHLADMNLAQGDLIRLVGDQAKAFRRKAAR